jgi:hypothetical protein
MTKLDSTAEKGIFVGYSETSKAYRAYVLALKKTVGSIAQSTAAETEYIAASDASKEAVWLRKLVSGLFSDKLETTVVHCNNQSCIKLTKPGISRQVKTY